MQDSRNTHSNNNSEAVAIYVRISADKAGQSLGVERQEQACRELAARFGWDVVQVFTDNDITAYSGKRRPGYEGLLELMKSGEIRVVLALHTDRIHRSPTELESFITICETNSVRVETVQAGPIDMSTATGRMGARIYGAVARHEVEHAIERMQAAKLQAAKSGKFLGGQRPYGFEPRRVALRDDEAAIVREMARRLTQGASFWSLAVDLNQRGVLTQHGKDWNALKVRNVLIRPINAGIVRHRGVEYTAESPAILSRDEWNDLETVIELNRRKSPHPGRFRKHLLNGFLYCGVCEKKLYHKSKQQRDGSYRTAASCGKKDNQTGRWHGCGGVSRMVEPMIDLVTDAIMYRLDSPELLSALQDQAGNVEKFKALYARQRALEARIVEVTDDYYVNNLLSREQFERTKLSIDVELREVGKSLQNEMPPSSTGFMKFGESIRAAWDSADLEWKRSLMSQLIEAIYVRPRPKVPGYTYPRYKGRWRFDPDLVDIRWRV